MKDLIIWPGVEKMTLISGGKTLEGSSELLGSPRMKDLVAELKTRYPDRFVIFDVPPVLSTADALGFAPLVDHVVMVVQAGKTPLPDVKKALEMLPREKILGIVLNRHEGIQKSYYYGYYHKDAVKKKPSAPEIRDLFRKKGEGRFSEILKKIQIGFLSRWGKRKGKERPAGENPAGFHRLDRRSGGHGVLFCGESIRFDPARRGQPLKRSKRENSAPPRRGVSGSGSA